jgi:pyruvate ferredoxin oxidoreductase gamma subunit
LMEKSDLVEIRWHGRGGQGAVTSAELLAKAAISEGKFAQAFPAFGPERRGAPVVAFNRISGQKPIRVRAGIEAPNIVVVLDATVLSVVNVTEGLKDGGVVVVNSKKTAAELKTDFNGNWRLAVIDATRIARETLGVPIVNTTMLGALIKASGVVKAESLVEPLQERFGRIAERNVNAMKRAVEETVVEELR